MAKRLATQSIVMKITEEIKSEMANFADLYKQEALNRVKERKEQPETVEAMGWAIDSELNSIQTELVKERVNNEWVEMFTKTIDQANSSYEQEFVAAMVESILTNHRTIQSEFFLRLIKVFDEISKSDDSRFDARNEWTKEMCKRFSFCVSHVGEIDRLRNMTEDELFKFRMGR